MLYIRTEMFEVAALKAAPSKSQGFVGQQQLGQGLAPPTESLLDHSGSHLIRAHGPYLAEVRLDQIPRRFEKLADLAFGRGTTHPAVE